MIPRLETERLILRECRPQEIVIGGKTVTVAIRSITRAEGRRRQDA
ncbi:MAG TPA: hypothetical protein VGC27_08855 [Rhizomicrobium sp.]